MDPDLGLEYFFKRTVTVISSDLSDSQRYPLNLYLIKDELHKFSCVFSNVDQDPDLEPLDPDPDPQKYSDPRIRIQEAKYQSKTGKKLFALKTIEVFIISKWLIKFQNKKGETGENNF